MIQSAHLPACAVTGTGTEAGKGKWIERERDAVACDAADQRLWAKSAANVMQY